jgi:serine/threonine protein kinase/tetratricopeptide (TPR) repeat protein
MALDTGARLGPYEILEPLGTGGMGEVYRARDGRLGRIVAIKVLRHDLAADRDRVERFEREARSASGLNHPNIVTIHDVGIEKSTSYIAMEWVDGTTLRELVATGRPQPVPAVVKIGTQIAEGLAKAHGAGIIHRDLKPDNVMVTHDGLVKILDFGLAKLAGPAADVGSQLATQSGGTAAGVLLGTVGYMSPEQATGAVVDYRSDQFALGIILYELATGRRAFRRESAPQTLTAIIEDELERVDTFNPRVPVQLSHVIARCLAKKPDERYESTRDLARDLRDLIHESSAPGIAAAPIRRRSLARVPLVATLVALVSLAAYLTLRSRDRVVSVGDNNRRVVAVLPFRDLTGDPARAYFAAGVTDEIRGQLAKLGALRVLSRSAVERYGDANVRGLRADLGAGSAVEGSVRLEGARVRVAVELVDTETEQTLWSEQYDRSLEEVLSVQRDVALRIAEALKATLSPAERQSVQRLPTTNPEAYQIYLQSQVLSSLDRQQNRRAIELLQDALKLDPGFAVAQARMAYRTFFLAYYEDPKYLDISIEQAQQAADMDPTLGTAHFALASSYALKGWAGKSRQAFLTARELAPNDTGPISNIAVLESEILGRHDEGVAWARRLLDLPPLTSNAIYHISWPLLFLRDDAVSERWLKEGEARFPDSPRLQGLLAGLDYLRGTETAALSRARKMAEVHPAFEEGLMVSAELSFLTGAPDAETQIARLFRNTPGLTTSPLLKPETHRTTYAHLLMNRGERARASTLLAESSKHAHAALADGNEGQRVPVEIAAIHAVNRQPVEALEWLERGLSAGYKDYSTLSRHPIFESLRREPRFQDLLKKMQQAVAMMRDRSTALSELRAMPFPAAPGAR